MGFEVVEKIHINKKQCKKVGPFLYSSNGVSGTLYLDMPWPFPVQIAIEDLKYCRVTPMFLKIPYIMRGWINHDILLRQIELLKLAEKGRILMHASCVDNTLIVGLPNAGKTYQTYKSRANGGRLISEEYTIIDSGRAFPYKPVMRTCFSARTMKDCGIKMNWKERLWLFVATIRATIFPFMYEAVIWKNIEVPFSSMLGSDIKKIVYGSTGREVKDWKEFAILCENEFPFMSSEFLQAYALATGFDLIGIQEKQRNLIKEFVESVYP